MPTVRETSRKVDDLVVALAEPARPQRVLRGQAREQRAVLAVAREIPAVAARLPDHVRHTPLDALVVAVLDHLPDVEELDTALAQQPDRLHHVRDLRLAG